MLRSILLLIYLCYASLVQAQFFANYTPADGMSNEIIHGLLQDSTGYLWIATQEGLDRFDGKHFKKYHHDPNDSTSLPHDHVEQMALAPDGRIWFTSFNGGLSVYDPSTDRFKTWTQITAERDTTVGLATSAIYCHNADSIYVGVQQLGVVLFLTKEHRQVVVGPLSQDPSTTAPTRIKPRAHGHGFFWVLQRNGLRLLDARQGKYIDHGLPDKPDRDLHFNSVGTDIYEDDLGVIWQSRWGGGLWKAREGDAFWRVYLPNDRPPFSGIKNVIKEITLINDRKFLLAYNDGIAIFDPSTERFSVIENDPGDPRSLLPGWINCIYRDRENVTWVGTKNGLSGWDMAQNRFNSIALKNPAFMSQPTPSVSDVIEIAGRLFVATHVGEGLLLYNGVNGTHPEKVPGIPRLNIVGAVQTRTLGALIFADEGIYEIDPTTLRVKEVLHDVFNEYGSIYQLGFLEDHEGKFWLGKQNAGVYYLDPISGAVEQYRTSASTNKRLSSDHWCQGIVEDHQNNVWISEYDGGLDRVNADRSEITHYNATNAPWLGTTKVWDVAVDLHNKLWIGTNGRGLIVTPAEDPGGPGTKCLLGHEGLPSMISTVYTDRDGSIWAGGPSGLFRVNSVEHHVRKFDHTEGLRRSSFHHAGIKQHANGMVSLCLAHNEVVFVDPSKLGQKIGLVNVVINEFQVNGKSLVSDSLPSYRKTIALEHDQNFLELGFGAVTTSMRSHVKLRYYLAGYDKLPVTDGPDGRAVYSDLSPGSYTFVVEQVLPEGLSVVISLPITITSAFWQTWWFRVLIACVLFAIALFVTKWRIGIMRDKERVRIDFSERLAEVEMNALRAQMNPHFLFNSLNSINRYIVHNEPRVASEYLTKFSRLMRAVLHNSEKPQVSLKDELETLKLYIEMESLRFKGKFTVDSRIELEEDMEQVMIPPLLLQPYVENAIWHGLMHRKDNNGKLSLHVFRSGEMVQFEIEDNGVGRKRASELKSRSVTHKGSMGMRITSERMQLVRSMYEVEMDVRIVDLYDAANKASGTKVVIRMQNLQINGNNKRSAR